MSAIPLDPTEGGLNVPVKPTATLEDVTSEVFDYVIVGGGTAGLALAARLADNHNVTVAVIEAGGHQVHTYGSIMLSAQFGREHRNEALAWQHKTTFQPNLGREVPWARGLGLGGSTSLNFLIFHEPPKVDLEAWENLGVEGWGWDTTHKAVKRATTFHPPTPEDAERLGWKFKEEEFGSHGPVHLSMSKITTAGEDKIRDTFLNLGARMNDNPAGGDLNGWNSFPSTIDPKNNTRSFGALAYFLMKQNRTNLKILTRATARKVIFKEGSGDLEAEGIEFDYNGAVHTVKAKREVIISAGAIRSSALLEHSGIGNKDILEPLGIKTLINNEAVGENVQEHAIGSVSWETNKEKYGLESLESMLNKDYAMQNVALHKEGKGLFLTQINNIGWFPLQHLTSPERMAELISKEEARIAQDLADPKKNRPGLKEQYEQQLQLLKDPKAVECEYLCVPAFMPAPEGGADSNKSYVSLVCGLNHPFSRGSIHIKSADPLVDPSIDPRYFDHEFDLELLVEMYKYGRKLAQSEPLKSIIVQEMNPGPNVVTDEDIKASIRKDLSTTWHTVGNCAMLPRDKGGVVDNSLKVYGTKNLRVCDISVLPLHVASHTQSLAYALGEQLSHILLLEKIQGDFMTHLGKK
ncbi:alcohol oxidase [Clavulina sp. PMI_390]|nr:alcohol oxidase [Clavulina sp. PMI_390]